MPRQVVHHFRSIRQYRKTMVLTRRSPRNIVARSPSEVTRDGAGESKQPKKRGAATSSSESPSKRESRTQLTILGVKDKTKEARQDEDDVAVVAKHCKNKDSSPRTKNVVSSSDMDRRKNLLRKIWQPSNRTTKQKRFIKLSPRHVDRRSFVKMEDVLEKQPEETPPALSPASINDMIFSSPNGAILRQTKNAQKDGVELTSTEQQQHVSSSSHQKPKQHVPSALQRFVSRIQKTGNTAKESMVCLSQTIQEDIQYSWSSIVHTYKEGMKPMQRSGAEPKEGATETVAGGEENDDLGDSVDKTEVTDGETTISSSREALPETNMPARVRQEVVDSLSSMAKSFDESFALAVPRAFQERSCSFVRLEQLQTAVADAEDESSSLVDESSFSKKNEQKNETAVDSEMAETPTNFETIMMPSEATSFSSNAAPSRETVLVEESRVEESEKTAEAVDQPNQADDSDARDESPSDTAEASTTGSRQLPSFFPQELAESWTSLTKSFDESYTAAMASPFAAELSSRVLVFSQGDESTPDSREGAEEYQRKPSRFKLPSFAGIVKTCDGSSNGEARAMRDEQTSRDIPLNRSLSKVSVAELREWLNSTASTFEEGSGGPKRSSRSFRSSRTSSFGPKKSGRSRSRSRAPEIGIEVYLAEQQEARRTNADFKPGALLSV